ncbi:putative GDSL-like Lipase/Acylhydrolase superfamily protein [Hibiscus syriacus]|uniref:GDSL-like Lipase/Acylhydrolase superfamily protein n=1 Tax=Hibiscus syriacus TaxID=106335 RepID=A0A6A3BL29_HIBSY|nr:putative GDSL-like Lipase/Acylhydrolase superfamily protein [Hibiscus syriacus]
MHDPIGIPSCFSFSDHQRLPDEPINVGRSGQSVFESVYRTKLAGECRLIAVTWCRNLLLRGLSVSIQGLDGDEHCRCKVELKPWCFWRKQGSKHFIVDGTTVYVVWDLKAAKFNGETEPQSDYYVVIVGEHIFGKRKFTTRVKFNDKGTFHDVSVECNSDGVNPVLEIRVDGKLAVKVKHLQWNFRGNESINVGKNGLQVFWDVHDWLFGSAPRPRHGLFIFNPIPSSPPSSSLSNQEHDSASGDFGYAMDSSKFCLFLYAWKVE